MNPSKKLVAINIRKLQDRLDVLRNEERKIVHELTALWVMESTLPDDKES